MLATDLKKEYIKWIEGNFDYNEIENKIIRIDTPFIDNDSDEIILYAEKINHNHIRISDDGWTLRSLENYGFSIDGRSTKRKNVLKNIITDYAVDFNEKNKEIYIDTPFDRYPVAKHRLLQAILKLNDLFLLKDDPVTSLFKEKIEKKLNEHRIFHGIGTPIEGKRGITIKFDFSISALNGKKEKFIRTISSPNNLNYTKVLAMDVSLIPKERNAEYYAIYDDISYDLNRSSEIEAIYEETNVLVKPLMFSQLEDHISLLTNNV